MVTARRPLAGQMSKALGSTAGFAVALEPASAIEGAADVGVKVSFVIVQPPLKLMDMSRFMVHDIQGVFGRHGDDRHERDRTRLLA